MNERLAAASKAREPTAKIRIAESVGESRSKRELQRNQSRTGRPEMVDHRRQIRRRVHVVVVKVGDELARGEGHHPIPLLTERNPRIHRRAHVDDVLGGRERGRGRRGVVEDDEFDVAPRLAPHVREQKPVEFAPLKGRRAEHGHAPGDGSPRRASEVAERTNAVARRGPREATIPNPAADARLCRRQRIPRARQRRRVRPRARGPATIRVVGARRAVVVRVGLGRRPVRVVVDVRQLVGDGAASPPRLERLERDPPRDGRADRGAPRTVPAPAYERGGFATREKGKNTGGEPIVASSRTDSPRGISPTSFEALAGPARTTAPEQRRPTRQATASRSGVGASKATAGRGAAATRRFACAGPLNSRRGPSKTR